MSSIEIGLWSFPVLILLIFLRVPIGAAMLATGVVGTYLVLDRWTPIMAQMKVLAWNTNANYSLSIIPLFLLMGQFAARGGMSQALFNAAAAFVGHRKGGVAMAAIGASAGFGSICGSSLATAATMAQVALPELKRNGYAGGLATATLAAGGTLGILIPPSVVLVIYAILAEQNIAKLFLAAFVPGIIAAISYLVVIAIYVRLKPESAGQAPRIPWKDRVPALIAVWPVVAIFFAVVGGIYLGWFTPTQAAAVGAVGAGLVAFANGGLDRTSLIACFKETAVSTGMIFFIILGASVFNSFLAFSRLPQVGAEWVTAQGFAPMTVLIIILLLYIIFGCIMDSLSMIVLTIPIFFPIVTAMDFGMSPEHFAIWFGILVLMVAEIGMITPPVGLNLFIISAMSRDVPIRETYKGIVPFVGADIFRIVLLTAFPIISIFLV
ncbi:MAG: TRAP transporter large permease [Alphaproteobacteria bacterium]|jgi:tripartite ATP-independent transporter DctM subunit|uniref:TRAP transporter large permease n=1 Tax=Rhizobium/Agrobacterium group TaxID=227290 RepID=UPI00083DEA0D|nr:TRAP transporter large permease [Agrobacterium sp. RAC06]AOG08249.1 TRAP transporter, DctM subunit [Agrobacterium sp. RAC06]MBU0736858.1 TRAP transporter large permease [Alphaproteobacteria bacterium]MBU0831712.1 TRAP transporter large permease [Alphaproteobacteria bacterium]MBU1766470.1 TRAP transporter large permease [Alphaproteobacteria bacterium]